MPLCFTQREVSLQGGLAMRAFLLLAFALIWLAPEAAAQIPMECYNRCNVDYGRCANVTQCQGSQNMCLNTCALEANLPPSGPAKPPPGGYGADALSSDGIMLGHAKNWDTAEGAFRRFENSRNVETSGAKW
jgi:hypothetical protein